LYADRPRRHLARGYATALFSVGLALSLTLLIQRFFPYPFLFLFFAAVMVSAWFGGPVPGFFAVLVSTIAVDYFFVPPFYSFSVNATEVTYFIAFILCALAASWVSSFKKNGEEALKDARDRLELRVVERTTELQRSNTELRESERRLRLLTEVIPQQIWSGTPDGSIDYCNQRLLDYVGRAMEEVRGDRFMETIHPEDRNGFRESWQRALSTGEPFEGEWRVRGAGGPYRSFFMRGVPLQDAQRQTLRWYGTSTDIEEHRKAEQALKRTQAELAHLSRVFTMGELTASIAHEVSQPLTAVVTYGHACLAWLSAEPPALPEARQTAERIIQDGTRAGAVLARIRALFKKESPATGWLDMNEVIQDLAVFLRDEAARRGIALRTDLSPGLPKVAGDRIQLQQVVLNLVVNGMDAMATTSGHLRELRIASRKHDETEILVLVEDSGSGLSPEIAGNIFNPFFTTKPQGIGMGLSISRSIIESHRGRLWASAAASGGAIFQFTIPAGSENES
jgi:PAS domain S-box-containing protein